MAIAASTHFWRKGYPERCLTCEKRSARKQFLKVVLLACAQSIAPSSSSLSRIHFSQGNPTNHVSRTSRINSAANGETSSSVQTDAPMIDKIMQFLLVQNGSFQGNAFSRLYDHYPELKSAMKAKKAGWRSYFEQRPELLYKEGGPGRKESYALAGATPVVKFSSISSLLPYAENVETIKEGIERALLNVMNASVYVFGSTANALGDSSSDIDFTLEMSEEDKEQFVNSNLYCRRVRRRGSFKRPRTIPTNAVPLHEADMFWKRMALSILVPKLQREGFEILQYARMQRIPFLKLKFGSQECDLTVNNGMPLFNTILLKAYSDIDPRLAELTKEVKAWARIAEVHGAALGHLSSYALTLLVIFYMQVRGALPCLQHEQIGPEYYLHNGKYLNVAIDLTSPRTAHLDIPISFSDFVTFYSKEYPWGSDLVVSVRTGSLQALDSCPHLPRSKLFLTEEDAANIINIEDPFETHRNLNCVIRGGNWKKLRDAFAIASGSATLDDVSNVSRNHTSIVERGGH